MLFAVTTLIVSACADSSSSAPRSGTTQTTGSTFAVQVDGVTPAFNATFAAYFPDSLVVHAGDTIEFRSVFRGNPHTVTLGTLVDQGLSAYDDAAAAAPAPGDGAAGGYGPAGSIDDHTIPQLAAIPDMMPAAGGDFNQAVAQPCFLDTGLPPGPGPTACPKRAQPPFDGHQSFYNSGWLAGGAIFKVRLAEDIPPGTYRYMCAMHRTDMTGAFTVVPGHGATYPDKSFPVNLARMQLQGQSDGLLPVLQAAKPRTPGTVAAGVASPLVDGPLAAVFVPSSITIPVGGTVTWDLVGPQDIAFNAPAGAPPDVTRASDGSVHANPLAWNEVGLSPSTAAVPANSAVTVAAFVWGGTGFVNTGVFNSAAMIRITFTKPAVYRYASLIHTGMTGEVVVAGSP